MDNEKKALFGVFDGHGGREVAVFCGDNYPTILKENDGLIDTNDEVVQEWLRTSFLKVDDRLRTPEG
jgi:serine/threonine protein phosphatase PrpC